MNIIEFFNKLELKPQWYSGRGMCGDRTLGIHLPTNEFGKCVAKIIRELNSDAHVTPELNLRVCQWLEQLRWDSMGMGSVFYSNWFPMSSEETCSLDTCEYFYDEES